MPPRPAGPAVYVNPFRHVRGLTPERIDMGVDYSGNGPVYALGTGKVTEVDHSWAGGLGTGPGTFISYRLDSGPLAGFYIYLAENVSAQVRAGQAVTAGTVLGTMSGGIETGFAAGPSVPGTTAAMMAGQSLPPPADPGGRPTAYGAAFSAVLKATGCPPGVASGRPFGSLPPRLTAALAQLRIFGLPSGSVTGVVVGPGPSHPPVVVVAVVAGLLAGVFVLAFVGAGLVAAGIVAASKRARA